MHLIAYFKQNMPFMTLIVRFVTCDVDSNSVSIKVIE